MKPALNYHRICRTLTVTALLLVSIVIDAQEHRRPPFNPTLPGVHDPVMAKGEDNRYYIFSTGMGVGVMSSPDMKTWRQEKPVFDMQKKEIPQWALDSVQGYRGHTWAPDISRHNGLWHIYYSCSSFGRNGSAIGLAVNKTLDPASPDFKWVDKGPVVVSHQHQDNWNAIDPNLIVDAQTGTPYLTYGSFWDGIQLIRLADDLQTPVTKPVTIARRMDHEYSVEEFFDKQNFEIEGNDTIWAGENAIEAPFITYNKKTGYYYLFVSFDYCCRGQASTYKTVYGRSRNIEGPYLDKDGKEMAYGGGTRLYGPDDEFFGVGHCSVYEIGKKWYFLSHAYDKSRNGESRLFLRPIKFGKDGWIK